MPQSKPWLQQGRRALRTFTSSFQDSISKPPTQVGLRQGPVPGSQAEGSSQAPSLLKEALGPGRRGPRLQLASPQITSTLAASAMPVHSMLGFPRPSQGSSLLPKPCKTVKRRMDLIYL